jgi:hypothetical protein
MNSNPGSKKSIYKDLTKIKSLKTVATRHAGSDWTQAPDQF